MREIIQEMVLFAKHRFYAYAWLCLHSTPLEQRSNLLTERYHLTTEKWYVNGIRNA